MKYQLMHFVLALSFVLCGDPAFGQSPPGPGPKKARTPDDYQPRTLKGVAAMGVAAERDHDGDRGTILHGDVLPSRVRVVYAGSTRPLPGNKNNVLQEWARKFAGNPAHYTVPYEAEVLFVEDGAEHWLAVEKKLIPRLGKELKKGEVVDLFVIRLGEIRTAGGREWLILVEGFQRQK